MYTDVTDSYKQVISKHSRHFVAKIKFDATGKVFEGKQIYNIKYDGGSSNTDYLTIGSVLSACLTVEMVATTYKMANRYFHLFIGLELSDGSIEWIPQGRYKVIDVQTKAGKTTLQCQDKLIMSDIKYVSRISYPAKISDILHEISEKINVQFLTYDYTDYDIKSKPTGYTIREMISMIAMMWGCFAVCNREGNIEFLWYTPTDYTITLDRTDAPEIAEDTYTLGFITCYYDGDNYYQAGNSEAEQGVEIENPYMSESILSSVYNKLQNFTYHAANIKYLIADPRIDVWDMVNIQNGNTLISIPIMSYTWDFDGGFSAEIMASVETASESEYRTGTAAASKSAENSAGTTVYYAALAQDKSFNTLSTSILSVDFAAKQSTVPIVGATIQLDLSEGGCVDFVIIYDNSTLCTFSEVYVEGKCCKALSLPLLGVGNGSHTITVAVKSDTAIGKAVGGACYGYVMGSGLAENTTWNGTITIRDAIDYFVIRHQQVKLADITDNVNIDVYSPINNTIIETIAPITLSHQKVTLADIIDTIPNTPIKAYNNDTDTIYIDFYNPILSADISVNIDALEITAVIGTTTSKLSIDSLSLSGLTTLQINLPTGSITGGTVSIAYTSSNGNLIDNAIGAKVADFVIAFDPIF